MSETLPRRARALAKVDVARQREHHPYGRPSGGKGMNQQRRNDEVIAWSRGYIAACLELVNSTDALDDAIVAWEAGGDAEALVAALDGWLERLEEATRMPENTNKEEA